MQSVNIYSNKCCFSKNLKKEVKCGYTFSIIMKLNPFTNIDLHLFFNHYVYYLHYTRSLNGKNIYKWQQK